MIEITADDFGLLEQEPEDWRPSPRVFGHDFRIPEFEMVSNPTVRLADIRRRRFDVIDRAQMVAREEIQAEQDEEIFAYLLAAGDMPLTARRLVQNARAEQRTSIDALRRFVNRWSSLRGDL